MYAFLNISKLVISSIILTIQKAQATFRTDSEELPEPSNYSSKIIQLKSVL